MARGRPLTPCPNVDDLRAMVAAGNITKEIMARFDIGYKTLHAWLRVHGIPKPQRRKPHSNPLRTSAGKSWQSMNTPEKLAALFTPKKLVSFWQRVELGSGCWQWKGAISPTRGYGQFGVGGHQVAAHRASWMIHNGPIPADLFVLHRCDNPPCVNPAHLFLGTNQDNYDDRDAKDRVRHGSRHPRAKLTEALVIELRASTESDEAWAKRMGMHPSVIRNARSGKRWKRVPGANPGFYKKRIRQQSANSASE